VSSCVELDLNQPRVEKRKYEVDTSNKWIESIYLEAEDKRLIGHGDYFLRVFSTLRIKSRTSAASSPLGASRKYSRYSTNARSG
jgi:hypothetical protein